MCVSTCLWMGAFFPLTAPFDRFLCLLDNSTLDVEPPTFRAHAVTEISGNLLRPFFCRGLSFSYIRTLFGLYFPTLFGLSFFAVFWALFSYIRTFTLRNSLPHLLSTSCLACTF